ncbi:Uncharacterised protein [Vibrio cholerae]|nr:Uncharacterised protein [Vibrio cholerae]CSC12675.1 Uncharacterised protein [Vibrio cholerae]
MIGELAQRYPQEFHLWLDSLGFDQTSVPCCQDQHLECMGQWQPEPRQYAELLSSFLSVSGSKIAVQFACKALVGKAPSSHLSLSC